jgi:iron complex outermembrane receptor protein
VHLHLFWFWIVFGVAFYLLWMPEVAIAQQAASVQRGSIRAIVSDAETGERLAGAVVRVEAREIGAIANPQGIALIKNLPVGSYTLLVNVIGYEPRKISVSVRDSDTNTVLIGLKSQLLRTNDVVVSAGKRAQAAQDVPISISTVGQREIQQRGITTIDQAMRYVPGVNVNRDQISVRGSSGFAIGFGSRVGVFLDGFSLLSGDGGDVKFDAIPMFNVERIEVVKGAGSALYGTGALGGVINIFTAPPSELPEFRLRTYAGAYTFPRFEEWRWRNTLPFLGAVEGSYSQKFGALGVLISGGFRRNEGHQDYYAGNQYTGLAKLSYEVSPRTTVNLLANYALEDRTNWVYWRSLRQATLPFAGSNYDERFSSQKLMVAADVRHIFSEGFFMTARAGLFNTDFTTITPTAAGNSNISSAANSWNAEVQLTSVLDSTLLVTYGVTGIMNEILRSPIIAPEAQRNRQVIGAAYAQIEWKPSLPELAGLTLTAGSRFDVEQTGALPSSGVIVSPKIGASYTLSEATQLRASFGGGFRAPVIAERFAALRFNTFTVLPNPTLLNERSWSSEIGAKHAFSLFEQDWSADIALFNNEFFNLIEPRLPLSVTQLTQPIQFQNITRARIQGVELALNGWLPGKILGVETGVTGMYPLDIGTSDSIGRATLLKYRSTVLWYSRLILPVGAFQIQADYRFQSRVEQIDDIITLAVRDGDARVPIHVVDVRLIANMYQLAGLPAVLTLNVRNALDYYYTEIIGNLAPTRNITLQLDVKL